MSSATSSPLSAPRAGARHLRPALWAALLGLVVLFVAGFTPLQVHNAAHDARHAFAFPCH